MTALIAAGALTGCHGGGGTTSTSASSSYNPSDTVVFVNGAPITEGELYTDMQAFVPTNQNGEPTGRAVLGRIIANKLTEGLAANNSVTPTDDEINDQITMMRLRREAASVKPFEDQLTDAGLTIDYVKNWDIIPMLCQINILGMGKTITDDQVSAFYNAHISDQFTVPERAHIKRIVLESKMDADDVSSQIQKGATFESLVSRSMDKSLPDGDLPQWVYLDQKTTVPQMANLVSAIKNTPIGGTSEPINVQGSWWIVKVVSREPRVTWPLDQVKGYIKVYLLQQAGQTDTNALNSFQQNMHNKQQFAVITPVDPMFKELVYEITNPSPVVPQYKSAPPVSATPAPAGKPAQ
jgi:hypothetical protein